MKFGIFIAPFHRVGENPTLCFERDMQLIEWLDQLGYEEAFIGEHHSSGWEIISSPEIFMGEAVGDVERVMIRDADDAGSEHDVPGAASSASRIITRSTSPTASPCSTI